MLDDERPIHDGFAECQLGVHDEATFERGLANPHGDAGRGSVAEVKRAVAGIVHGEIASAHDPRQHQLQGKKHDEGGTSLIAPLKPMPSAAAP